MAAQKTGDASSHRRPMISQTAPSSRTSTPDAKDKSLSSEVISPRSKPAPFPLAIDASDHKPPPHNYSPPGTKNETQHSPARDSPSPPLIARISNGSGTHTPAESPAAALISMVTRSEFNNLSRRLEATELSYEESQSEVRQQSSALEQLKLQLEAIATDTIENKASIAAIKVQLEERQAIGANQNESLDKYEESHSIESPELIEDMSRQRVAEQIRIIHVAIAAIEQNVRTAFSAQISPSLYPIPHDGAAAAYAPQREPPQPPSSALQKDGSSSFSCCCGPCWAGLLGSSAYQQHNDEEQC